MKQFVNGVSYYTTATVEIGFPEDDVCCHWCPFLSHDYKLDRERCGKTGEVLIAPKYDIGYMCPLNFKNEEN
jgi:hypothetical protein